MQHGKHLELSSKLKLVVRRNVRQSGTVFNKRDEMSCKRDNKLAWKGPCQVLGQDGPVVWTFHQTKFLSSAVNKTRLEHHYMMKHRSIFFTNARMHKIYGTDFVYIF